MMIRLTKIKGHNRKIKHESERMKFWSLSSRQESQIKYDKKQNKSSGRSFSLMGENLLAWLSACGNLDKRHLLPATSLYTLCGIYACIPKYTLP